MEAVLGCGLVFWAVIPSQRCVIAGEFDNDNVLNRGLSNLFRNVPFLASLEVSLFFSFAVVVGVSAGAKPCAASGDTCDPFNLCNFILCSYPRCHG